MAQHPVNKYLSTYAESEVRLVEDFPDYHYQHVLIIPAYRENPTFLEPYLDDRFQSLLLILVVNQPDTDDQPEPQQTLIDHLNQLTTKVWQSDHVALYQGQQADNAILCISRFQEDLRLAHKQAVGLARKIAADCALQLIQSMHIESTWIASTDADSQLPDNYFDFLNSQQDYSALTFEFEHHQDNSPTSNASRCYEQSLRYYQAGLQWAGSSYAFYSLGSCLAVDAQAYAQVRGFPKRAGGEDFYLLNKIAKLGHIRHCPEIKINILSRQSERVPFGTGPAVKRLLSLASLDDFHYYQPAVFDELKSCLTGIGQLSPTADFSVWQNAFDPDQLAILMDFGLERLFRHQRDQNLTRLQIQHSLKIWFDGLLSLRFIHSMRDLKYPDIPFHDAVKHAQFWDG